MLILSFKSYNYDYSRYAAEEKYLLQNIFLASKGIISERVDEHLDYLRWQNINIFVYAEYSEWPDARRARFKRTLLQTSFSNGCWPFVTTKHKRLRIHRKLENDAMNQSVCNMKFWRKLVHCLWKSGKNFGGMDHQN